MRDPFECNDRITPSAVPKPAVASELQFVRCALQDIGGEHSWNNLPSIAMRHYA